jgi:hypothetical protein
MSSITSYGMVINLARDAAKLARAPKTEAGPSLLDLKLQMQREGKLR